MKRKRFIVFLTTVLLVIVLIVIICVLAGQHKKKTQNSGDNAEQGLLHDDIFMTDPIPSFNPSIYSGNKVKGSPFAGSFINSYVAASFSSAEEVFEDKERIPQLRISDDGSFSLRFSSFEIETIEIKGTLTVDDTLASFTVTSGSITGFLGDSVNTFNMRLVGTDDLKYEGEQIGTITGGDIFSRIKD